MNGVEEQARRAKILAQLESQACEHSLEDYRADVQGYLWDLEFQNRADPAMIESQPELEWYMRPYLIDFLIELHGYFRLRPETLFLACSIADRYLSKRMVYKKHYQLVMTTALWIAAKYEDKKSRTPLVRELVALCRDVYDSTMFAQMELHMLSTLGWNVGSVASVYGSLSLFLGMDIFSGSPAGQAGVAMLSDLAGFLAELSMYEKDYMYFSTAVQALSAVLVASKVLNNTAMADFIYCSLAHQQGAVRCGTLCAHSPKEQLPLLRLDEQTLEDIRQCSLLFVNDLYKTKTLNKPLPAALLHKYSRSSFEPFLERFTSCNMNSFITLTQLTQAVGSSDQTLLRQSTRSLTDICIGLLIPPTTADVANSRLALHTFDGSTPCGDENAGRAVFRRSSSACNTLGVPSAPQLSMQTLDVRCSSPAASTVSANSVFSSGQSTLSQSSASSPMLLTSRKQFPIRMNSFSSVYSHHPNQRVLTRFDSTESTMAE